MQYELTPIKPLTITRKGGKDIKNMSKTTNTPEVKTAKTRKAYSKTRGEHFKDIVIAVLITSIVMFIAGAQFQSKQHRAVDQAIKNIIPSVNAQEPTKK